MPNVTLTAEDFNALMAERETAITEREALRGELRVVKVERDLLKEKLNAFLRKLFAAKSEARGNGQAELFNEAEALASANGPVAAEVPIGSGIEIAGHTRQKRGRKPLDAALPREIVRHELPESERLCPHDGKALVEIGVEISEQLDIIPQQVRVIQHQRVKYACPCCDQRIKLTPVPARIIPKGLLTEAALAWVATSKYQDALPLYRQAALIGRFGGDLSRNTLAGSMVKIGEAVQPIINLLRDHLLDSELVFGDETVIQVLKEPGRAAQSKSYLWAQMNGTGPPVRLFGYASGRGGTHAEQLYAGIREGAVLMSDGYEVYNGIAHAHRLVHLGCWAHARRYFVEAEAVLPKSARGPDQLTTQFIAAISRLYAVEAKAKGKTADERAQLRNVSSRPILAEIQHLLVTHRHSVTPGSLLGKAMHYLEAQWPKLIRYAEHGAWPIDNNLCENAIRPFVVGRRNWLFADTVPGAHASANIYSLIETCKINGVEPFAYLSATLTAIAAGHPQSRIAELLPWNFKPAN